MTDKTQLKLYYLLPFFTILASIAIAWGGLKQQQDINDKNISDLESRKLDKALFDMHQETQKIEMQRTHEMLQTISAKIDCLIKESKKDGAK